MRLILFITLILMSPLALANGGGDECKNMNAHAVMQDFQEPCEVNTDYDFCIINKMRGTLNGTMFEYFKYDWLVLLEDLGVPTPPAAGESYYNREFAELSTKHGMIWGELQYVFENRHMEAGGVAMPMMVTGGTGIYEDAGGWITWTITDNTLGNFSIDGRVCGPNIPDD